MNSTKCASLLARLSIVILLLSFCKGDSAFLRRPSFQNGPGDDIIIELQKQARDLESYIRRLQKELIAERTIIDIAEQGKAPTRSKRFLNPFADHSISAYRTKSSEVGFHVALDKNFDLSSGQTMHFDYVLANIGSSFDPDTSTFIVPKAGTYLLTLNVVCNDGSFMHLSILQNGVPIFNSLCDNRNGESWTQGGGTTIMPLNRGDRVNVGMIWPAGVVATAYGNGMTTFSGYLLREH